MANLEHQEKWEKWLNQNHNQLERSLNLTNKLVEHLRREEVIFETEYERLMAINEMRKNDRYLELNEILRRAVASVRFQELVSVLQIKDYRCLTAAKLFLSFAESIGHDTSNWISKELDIPETLALFTVPRNMTCGEVPTVGAFELETAIPPYYLQRSTDISNIRAKFNDTECNGNPSLSKLVIISGIGGIGKSTISSLFALNVIDEVDNAIWVRATSTENMTSTFARLGEVLGISTGYKENKVIPLESFRTQLYNKLCQARTLIVMDNADSLSPEDLEQFLPSVMPAKQYRPLILVTSRPNDWGKFQSNVLNLDLLEDDVAVDYLMKRLGSLCPSQKVARKLVQFYGNLIIAIEASINLILLTNKCWRNSTNSVSYTVSDLLQEVKFQKIKITDLQIELGTVYDPLEKLWTVTFEKLQDYDAGRFALRVLDLCSCLEPDRIPVLLLECVSKKTQHRQLFQAIQILIDYSLLDRYETSEQGVDLKFLKMHRVLQKVCWKRIGSVNNLVENFQTCVRSLPVIYFFANNDPFTEVFECLWTSVGILMAEVKAFTFEKLDPDVVKKLTGEFFGSASAKLSKEFWAMKLIFNRDRVVSHLGEGAPDPVEANNYIESIVRDLLG